MGPHDRLDVEPLLVAEVVVHRGNVRAGRLADVADRRRLEAPLGEDLPGGFENSVSRPCQVSLSAMIYALYARLKHLFQSIVS